MGALKGIVRLQAIIRGWAVRRQAMTTLKCLQSVVNIQSQVCARRFQMAEGTWQYDENKQLLTLKDKIIKVCVDNANNINPTPKRMSSLGFLSQLQIIQFSFLM